MKLKNFHIQESAYLRSGKDRMNVCTAESRLHLLRIHLPLHLYQPLQVPLLPLRPGDHLLTYGDVRGPPLRPLLLLLPPLPQHPTNVLLIRPLRLPPQPRVTLRVVHAQRHLPRLLRRKADGAETTRSCLDRQHVAREDDAGAVDIPGRARLLDPVGEVEAAVLAALALEADDASAHLQENSISMSPVTKIDEKELKLGKRAAFEMMMTREAARGKVL